jgi:hypothetical protein
LALMLIVMVRQWLAPWVPIAAGLGIAAVLSASIGYLYCEKERRRAVLMGFGICAAIALPTALWIAAPVRAAAVEHLSSHLPETVYQRALDDDSRQVRISACVHAAQSDSSLLDSQIVDLFVAAPSEGVECVDRLGEDHPSRALAVSSRFVRRWGMALYKQDAKLVCGTAPHLFSLAAPEAPRPAQQLTYCATTSIDPTISRCCADAVTEHYDTPKKYTIALGEPSSVSPQRRVPLFLSMVVHAFRGVDASRTSLPTLQRRLLRKKPVQDWILALGCQALFSQERADDIVNGLEAVVQSNACPSADKMERHADNWIGICQGLSGQAEPTGAMCSLVRGEAVKKAVGNASAEVRKALDALYAGEMGRDIVRGNNQIHSSLGSTSAYGQFVVDASAHGGGVGDAQSRQFARMMNSHYPEAAEMMAKYADGVQDFEGPGDDATARKLQNQSSEVIEGVKKWEKHWPRMNSSQREKVRDAIMVDGRKKAMQQDGR